MILAFFIELRFKVEFFLTKKLALLHVSQMPVTSCFHFPSVKGVAIGAEGVLEPTPLV